MNSAHATFCQGNFFQTLNRTPKKRLRTTWIFNFNIQFSLNKNPKHDHCIKNIYHQVQKQYIEKGIGSWEFQIGNYLVPGT